jgi:hypothetical protein
VLRDPDNLKYVVLRRVCDKCVKGFTTYSGKRIFCYTCEPKKKNERALPDPEEFDILPLVFGNAHHLHFKTTGAIQKFLSQLLVLVFNGTLTPKDAKYYKDLAMAQATFLKVPAGPSNKKQAAGTPTADQPEEPLSAEDLDLAKKSGYNPDGYEISKAPPKPEV